MFFDSNYLINSELAETHLLGRKVDFAPPEADVHLRPSQPWSGGELA